MVRRFRIFRRLLLLEGCGFAVVIASFWLDEWLDLPRRLFGASPSPPRVSEALTETLLALLVCVTVIAVSRRAFARIEYLEWLVVMCAWCRRVRSMDQEDEWVTVEAFLAREHLARTSHGICDRCAEEVALPSPPPPV